MNTIWLFYLRYYSNQKGLRLYELGPNVKFPNYLFFPYCFGGKMTPSYIDEAFNPGGDGFLIYLMWENLWRLLGGKPQLRHILWQHHRHSYVCKPIPRQEQPINGISRWSSLGWGHWPLESMSLSPFISGVSLINYEKLKLN